MAVQNNTLMVRTSPQPSDHMLSLSLMCPFDKFCCNRKLISELIRLCSFCFRTVGRSANPWLPQLLCWCRERNNPSTAEKHRLVLFTDTLIHHWTVTIALNVGFKPLIWITPHNIARLAFTIMLPCIKAFQTAHDVISIFRCDHVDKSITKSQPASEICWKVHKIISSFESLIIHELADHFSSVRVRQISDDHCCFGIIDF